MMSTVDGFHEGPNDDFWTDAGDEFYTFSPEQLDADTLVSAWPPMRAWT